MAWDGMSRPVIRRNQYRPRQERRDIEVNDLLHVPEKLLSTPSLESPIVVILFGAPSTYRAIAA